MSGIMGLVLGNVLGASAGPALSQTSTSSMTVSGSGTSGDPFVASSTNQNIDDSTAFVEFTASGDGTLTYDVRVSSEENFDDARLIVNGDTIVDINGINSAQGTEAILDGQVVRFEYEKDGSVSQNDDTGYLDELYII